MTYQKGAVGVRWTSSDENGDSLVYNLEMRGSAEKNWKMLKDKVHEKYYSFDSTAFPDAAKISDSRYCRRMRRLNTPEDALTSSERRAIRSRSTTLPPSITGMQVSGTTVKWRATDALSTIYKAEYSVDGGDWTVVDPVGKLSDAKALDYALALKGLSAGEHVVAVRVSDENDNVAVEKGDSAVG